MADWNPERVGGPNPTRLPLVVLLPVIWSVVVGVVAFGAGTVFFITTTPLIRSAWEAVAGVAIIYLCVAITAALMIHSAYRIWRHERKTRWTLVAALALAAVAPAILGVSPVPLILSLGSVASIALLFASSSRAWFEATNSTGRS